MSQLQELDITGLVRRAQEGDGKALEAFLLQMQPIIYFSSLKLLGSQADAEDMTQEVYIKILQGLPDLRDPAAAPAWVKRIVANSCINHRKKARDYVFEEEEQGERIFDSLAEDNTDALPGDYMDMYAKREIITGMIDALPAKQRSVVYLYYYNELSIEEIAQLMEISAGTVKSRLAAARTALKAQVESEEKKGNKLYVFFPFLGRMLWEESQTMKLPPFPVPKETVLAEASRRGAQTAYAGDVAAAGTGAAKTTGAAAAGKVGTGLGGKLVAGLLAVSLIGGAAIGIPTLLGSGKEEPPVSTEALPPVQTPLPTSTPEQTSQPSPEPSDAPNTDFDPEALLGQGLSALTELLGEPAQWYGDTSCTWRQEDGMDIVMAELFEDGETIRGITVVSGPAILGVLPGDSPASALAALESLSSPGGVSTIDAGNGQTIYVATTADMDRIYQFSCINETVSSISVNLNALSVSELS